MEKDVKIGLVIGLIFVVALIAFFAYRTRSQGGLPPPPVITTAKDGLDGPAPATPEGDMSATPGVTEPPPGVTPAPTPTPEPAGMPPTPGPTIVAEATTYVVKKGDSLWKIAEEVYGDGTKGKLIADANKDVIKDPDKLTTGMKLTIPAAPPKAPGAPTAGETGTEQAATGRQKHVVAKGETYWSLAQKYYHDGSQWKRIAEANPGVKPDELRAGITINIPAAEKKSTVTPPATTPAPTTPAPISAPAPAPTIP